MSSLIALLICILLIFYLLVKDQRNIEGVSRAIWIPLTWMLLGGSRYVSRWFDLGGSAASLDPYIDGSPVDRAIFLFLMVVGAAILVRRRLDWRELFFQNKWLWMFFIFSAISILWSDYPFVSFKRWNKAFGNVIMVLLILTEKSPYEAIGVILMRIAFVLLPLSVLFIKYYPNLGRAYHMGYPTFIGVATQKNGLGQICLLSGIYFSWLLLLNRQDKLEVEPEMSFSIYVIIFPMIAWLLYMANSATSLACTIIAVSLLLLCRLPAMVAEPNKILTFGIAIIVFFVLLDLFFGLTDTVISILGRNTDLTARVPMWKDLLGMVKNPLIGFGYGSFWLGDRQAFISGRWGVFGQAHNGYLQVYLELGLIGIFILLGWVLSGLKKVKSNLKTDYPVGILRLCFILVVVFYNWTEAVFYGVSNMWVLFILGGMDAPIFKESINYNM